MTLIVDETFEGAGYEELWSEEVGAGNTVNEDADTADAGSPSGWGSQCLYIDYANTANACSTGRDHSSLPIAYTRIEFVLNGESLADGESVQLAIEFDGSFEVAWVLLLEQISGSLYFRLECYHNGSSNVYTGFTAITTGTRQRIEIKWDATNNLWAWRHNGVDQPNDQDASDPVTSEGLLTSTHVVTSDLLGLGADPGFPAIYDGYFDRIAIDDADWVDVYGVGSITLPQFTLSSQAHLDANVSITLPLATVDATGGPGLVDITLPQITLSVEAHLPADVGITLPQLSVQGGGAATGVITLPVLTVVGASLNLGTFAEDLPQLTINATAPNLGVFAQDLPALSVTVTAPNLGVFDQNLPQLTLSVQAHLQADVTITLPSLTINAESGLVNSVDITLPQFVLNVLAHLPADAAITLPQILVQAGLGFGGDITLPALTLLIKGYKGAPPDCVVMNAKTFAISEYKDYGFNSMVKFNGNYVIADANGIYEQDESNTDEGGYFIKANVKSGEFDTYDKTVQRMRNGFLTYESDGDIRLSTFADETITRRYPLPLQNGTAINERRIKFERGIKDRVFDFNIENVNGSSLELESLRVMLEPIIGKKG